MNSSCWILVALASAIVLFEVLMLPWVRTKLAAIWTWLRIFRRPRIAPVSAEAPRSGKWPTVRKHHLEKEPACIACGGTDHLTVHHIAPFHLHPAKELDPDNLATLCEHPSHNCHLIWGHYCDFKRYFNPTVRADAGRYFKALSEARGQNARVLKKLIDMTSAPQPSPIIPEAAVQAAMVDAVAARKAVDTARAQKAQCEADLAQANQNFTVASTLLAEKLDALKKVEASFFQPAPAGPALAPPAPGQTRVAPTQAQAQR
jgi:5-methylcytosine-specific restriction protein A